MKQMSKFGEQLAVCGSHSAARDCMCRSLRLIEHDVPPHLVTTPLIHFFLAKKSGVTCSAVRILLILVLYSLNVTAEPIKVVAATSVACSLFESDVYRCLSKLPEVEIMVLKSDGGGVSGTTGAEGNGQGIKKQAEMYV